MFVREATSSPTSRSKFRGRVFNEAMQERYLSSEIIQHLKEVRAGNLRFEASYADAIAEGLRQWAMQNGANAYAHWFQPLTNLAAEKHDSFLSWDALDQVIEHFRGKDLLFGEPDASSFPSGGLRSTHQARGYTAWDPASLPFLWESAAGRTLYIPALFYSWKGSSLDHKLPLLRSEQKIAAAASRLLSLCKIDARFVFPTLGIEQEYFLIDRSLYLARRDLLLAGRTVFGSAPSKGQELEEHYFGLIGERAMAFIRLFEEEALELGIPIKTRHNEVAPSQYETAPLFEKASIATDHNIALMQLMKQSAAKLGLACLFHEKPFAYINGSGKHNNWSLATDTGLNLLDPKENSLTFLILLTAILRAVHEHHGLLFASIASAGNDCRLGGSEAPPAIPSIFLGDELYTTLQNLIQDKPLSASMVRKLDMGLEHLPPHHADASDRNRTSFFAFTGNKFELRAVGASASPAFPISVLNAIVADSLELILDGIEGELKGQKECTLETALPVLQKYLRSASPILFEGNAYSSDWHEEASARGLSNLRSSFHAYDNLRKAKSIRVLEEVMSEQELESRYEVLVERYSKTMAIESNLMIDLFLTNIVPAVERDLQRRFELMKLGQKLGQKLDIQQKLTNEITTCLESAHRIGEEISQYKKQSADFGWEAKAKVYAELVAPKMKEMRAQVDALEKLVDDHLWPMPKYQELLFHS